MLLRKKKWLDYTKPIFAGQRGHGFLHWSTAVGGRSRTSISMVDCDYKRLNQRIMVFGQYSVEGVVNALGIATLAFWSSGSDQERLDDGNRLTGKHGVQGFFDRRRLTGPFGTSRANKERFCQAEPGFRCNCRRRLFHWFNVPTVASLMIDGKNERLDHAACSVTCDGGNRFINCVSARLLALSLPKEWNQERFNHLYRTLGADRRYRFLNGSWRSTRGLREQEGFAQSDVLPVRSNCGQRLFDRARLVGAVEHDEERFYIEAIDFLHARCNPLQRLLCQRFLTRKDILSFQVPVDDFSGRSPWFEGRRQEERGLQRDLLTRPMGGHWPTRSAFSSRDNEQAIACRCIPVVSATNNPFVHAVTKRTRSLEERLIGFTDLRLEGLAVCSERTPPNKFRYVLDYDIFDVQFLRPLNHTPGRDAFLVFDRPAAASD